MAYFHTHIARQRGEKRKCDLQSSCSSSAAEETAELPVAAVALGTSLVSPPNECSVDPPTNFIAGVATTCMCYKELVFNTHHYK